MSSGLLTPTRQKRLFYATNVNMNYSFDTLEEMATKMLGASLEVGDILICDNAAGDKRKMLQMTKKGFIIVYGRLNDKGTFEPLADKDGMLKRLSHAVF